LANAGLEKIVLDGIPHQIVVNGLLSNLFILLDSLVVIAFDGGSVGDFEP
jgi:hypothetical protein